MTHKPTWRRKLRSLYTWHRYAGLTAALLILVLALSGIALNHTDRLQLDKRYVQAEWLLDWYGIRPREEMKTYKAVDTWLVYADGLLYLGNHPVEGKHAEPLGVIRFTHFFAVALQGEILLLSSRGEIIEKLGGAQGVPAGMKRIGLRADGNPVVEAAHGFYVTDRDFLGWREAKEITQVQWSHTQQAPEVVRQQILRLYRGQGLPLERVMLDLHSGRIFGKYGSTAMDFAAVVLIFLSMSGGLMWLKQLLRKRRRRKESGKSR